MLKVGGAIFGVLALIGGLNLLAIYLKRAAPSIYMRNLLGWLRLGWLNITFITLK